MELKDEIKSAAELKKISELSLDMRLFNSVLELFKIDITYGIGKRSHSASNKHL